MARAWLALALATALCSACSTPGEPTHAQRVQQVTAAETAFAQTMADRDHAAFLAFVADEAVFLGGGKPLRGKAAVGDAWKRFFANPQAPFAWKPDHVEVLPSGTLAQTKGLVRNAQGQPMGRFYSTWRLDADGRWRVVFDDGYDLCESPRGP
jgi:ketosteroid isomerase-like protein